MRFGLFALFFSVLPAAAQALVLECSLPQTNSGGGYVTETYVLQHDESTGKALASDGLIMYVHDAPIEAKVSEDTKKKLVLSWSVQITNRTGQQTKMRFRAVYFRDTKQVTIRATPGGYDNSFEARGTCKSI
ncbi:MAG: hypothetical protein HC783_12530 [Rhodobacteraceae bacterium]|nr:hypothetical protein [Paracoccaceae bacterium]